MALNVSAWSIRQPLPAIVFSIVLLALGWMSFLKLPITRLPNADIPVVSVVVVEFGAAPAELEAQVTKPIEDAVSGVEGVHNIISTITDGVSATTIMFTLESNTDRALNDVNYGGPLSVEWEDGGMDREFGAAESAAYVKAKDFPPSKIIFDAQFDKSKQG